MRGIAGFKQPKKEVRERINSYTEVMQRERFLVRAGGETISPGPTGLKHIKTKQRRH